MKKIYNVTFEFYGVKTSIIQTATSMLGALYLALNDMGLSSGEVTNVSVFEEGVA